MSNQIINRALRRSALTVALGLCFASSVHAQSNTTGNVFGEAGAGETVTVLDPSTGVTRSATVDADGSYRITSLPPGSYAVTVRHADGTVDSREQVQVVLGTGTQVDFVAATGGDATTLGTIQVFGSRVNPIDVSSVESTTIMTEAQIDRLPVFRDQTSVALLAPGTVKGDSSFGNLASFGGASVAENVYYVNGFNVTNIVKGLAFNEVPFEAIAQQQIKTGGYGAEFGRSLGGVINVITKRGSNEWEAGFNVFWSPDSLAEGERLAYDPTRDGVYEVVDTGSVENDVVYNVHGSGPIIKDKLFFYGLFQGQKQEYLDNYESGHEFSKTDSPQGLLKIDWNITDNHLLEVTAFRDREETTGTTFQRESGDLAIGGGEPIGTFQEETGGDTYIAKWTGYLTQNFTLSALYGKSEYSRGSQNSNSVACPVVIDARSSGIVQPFPVFGCWVDSVIGDPDNGDERKAWRIDGEWALGDHLVRFGMDNEEFVASDGSVYSGTAYDPSTPGGIYWRYSNVTPGDELANGGIVPPGVTEAVRLRYFENGGTFTTENKAWYIEDTWSATDSLILYGGIRNESFTNLNATGGAFVEIKDTWAPRLGFSWDVNNDSTLKIFGNAGRYYIPVYANTNVRLAGSELDYIEYYQFSDIDPVTGEPTLGAPIGTRLVQSSGETPDPLAVVDNNLDPMFQDEYILGAQFAINEDWSAGVRGIYRDLKSGMDDICDGTGATAWALENGYTASQASAIGDALFHCFLTNPGQDLSANVDLDGTGELSVVNIPGAAIGIPEADRTYKAVELFFERTWDDKWFLQGSYTWAKSHGNTEGYVKSDNGQDDAGITQDFDFPGLMDGSTGYLPNDRRHTLKVFGAYQLADEWRIGANLIAQSGRPYNCFGVYPSDGPDPVAAQYGSASFYCRTANSNPTLEDGSPNPNYEPSFGTDDLVPRGTAGRVGWIYTLDLQLAYEPRWVEGLTLRMDVNNVLDAEDHYSVAEFYEGSARDPLNTYTFPTSYVNPRTVRFSVEYDF